MGSSGGIVTAGSIGAVSTWSNSALWPSGSVLSSLSSGQSTVMQLVGDSTGILTAGSQNGTNRWFARLGLTLGSKFPTHNVWYREWDDTAQVYKMPVELAAGPSGASGLNLAGVDPTFTWSANAITGDLDVIAKVKPAAWTSAATQSLLSRFQTSGNQKAFYFGIAADGKLRLNWYPDGSTAVSKSSTVAAPFTAGDTAWLRATLDVDNGAGGCDVKFYTSLDGATWTQLGTTVTTAGTTSIYSSTAPYRCGSLDTTVGSVYNGAIYWVEIRDGIGGTSVVPPLLSLWDQASPTSGNNVTVVGSPTLLLVNGSIGGQGIDYFDNATRRPKLMAEHGQSLIFLSTGHNEGLVTAQAYATKYGSWVANIKTLLPNVPIVCVTQNATKSPSTANSIAAHRRRAATLLRWGWSTSGIRVVDTYRAFSDVATQVSSDGVHPTAAGDAAWAEIVYRSIFEGAS